MEWRAQSLSLIHIYPGDDGDVVVAGEEAHGVEGHDAGQKGDALVGQRLGLGKGAHKTGGVLPCLFQTLPQQTVRLRRLHHLCQQGGGLLHDAAGGALVLLQMGVQRQQSPPVGRGQAGEVHVVDEVADGVQLLRRGEGVFLILAHGGDDVPQPLLGCCLLYTSHQRQQHGHDPTAESSLLQ